MVWHTQGSGKSLTMAFYAGRVIREPAMRNLTVVVLSDRNDLGGGGEALAAWGLARPGGRPRPGACWHGVAWVGDGWPGDMPAAVGGRQ